MAKYYNNHIILKNKPAQLTKITQSMATYGFGRLDVVNGSLAQLNAKFTSMSTKYGTNATMIDGAAVDGAAAVYGSAVAGAAVVNAAVGAGILALIKSS